jgi:hypothetical protein
VESLTDKTLYKLRRRLDYPKRPGTAAGAVLQIRAKLWHLRHRLEARLHLFRTLPLHLEKQ